MKPVHPKALAFMLVIAALIALSGFVLGGCGTGGGASGVNAGTGGTGGSGGEGFDQDAGLFADAGVDDSTTDLATDPNLFADPSRADDVFSPVPPIADPAGLYESEVIACFESANECGATGCEEIAACCVGTSVCCEPIDSTELPDALDFTACAGQSVPQCFLDNGVVVQTFGPPADMVQANGLGSMGSVSADSGVVVGPAVDLAQKRLSLEATFVFATNCGDTCVDSLGLGVAAATASLTPNTRTDIALLYSGARSQMQLRIAGNAVQSWDATSPTETWTLTLNPNGTVQAQRNGVEVGDHEFSMGGLRNAKIVVYGRSLSETADQSTLTSLSALISNCDQPDSWSKGTNFSNQSGDRPTIETDGSETRLAFIEDGRITWGTVMGSAFTPLSTDALKPSFAYESQGISDPELLWDGSQWHLFYSAINATGIASIGHATAQVGETVFTQDSTPTLSTTSQWQAFDAPTVYRRDDLWLMVVRGTTADGGTELVPFYRLTDTDSWKLAIGSTLPEITRVAANSSDALTDPSLIVHNGAYQLYVGRRRGTEWTIELLSSDEMSLFRELGEVLRGTDALNEIGVAAPDALGLEDVVELVYSNRSGEGFSVHRTSRVTP